MATRKENLKSLFTNSRTRIIIIFTAIILLISVIIGITKFLSAGSSDEQSAKADITGAPGIRSIPGALDPTVQYAKLQEQQNVSQAQIAAKTGSSAIPTIVRTQALGKGVGVVGAKSGKSGVGFEALTRQSQEGAQKSLWIQDLKESNCSAPSMTKVLNQGATLDDLKQACSCAQLKDNGYSLEDLKRVCACKQLKAIGFNARQMKDTGSTARQLRNCGFDACELRNAGFTAEQMKDGGFSDGELKGAGYSPKEINDASGLPDGITASDIRNAGCGAEALKKLRQAGVTAAAIRRISGCSASQLRAAGYTAKELRDAGFTAAELKKAGFTAAQLKAAGYSAADLLNAGFTPDQLKKAGFSDAQIEAAKNQLQPSKEIADAGVKDCSVASLTKARQQGISAKTIRDTLGCTASQFKAAGYTAKQLKDAGFTAAELKNAGFTAAQLKNAGFSAKELKDAGFTAAQLKNAGFSAQELKDAGFTAAQLKNAGFSANQLKNAGFNAEDLKNAGFNEKQLKDAGFSDSELKNAGFEVPDTTLAGIPSQEQQKKPSEVSSIPSQQALNEQTAQQQRLQEIIKRQNQKMAEQRYKQVIQQRASMMTSAANQALSNWKNVSMQQYAAGQNQQKKTSVIPSSLGGIGSEMADDTKPPSVKDIKQSKKRAIIKAGDVIFAVLDTSINSDEPSPILATVVSGKLKGSKLIGSFNVPANSDKMIIRFNTLSVPSAPGTTSISAYAIDPETARTAISTRTNHHYLMRYGSLFASSFLEGFGAAFQSANTTVTIGGTGGGDNITVQNGINRSALENAIIGLTKVGKSWGQQVQKVFNTPKTVEVCSGTSVGVLFTQDLTSL